MPTASALPEPTAEPTPATELTASETDLLERAAGLDCEAVRSTDEPVAGGPQATVNCQPPDEAAATVTLRSFEDTETLRARWEDDLAEVQPALQETDDACESGEAGSRKWGFGAVGCLVDGGIAQLTWTDTRSRTYGVVEGPDADLAELYSWWKRNARKVGRPVDATETDTVEPRPSNAPPLVRVPGRPRDISCDDLTEPILDTYDRKWRLNRVRFLNRGGYERVVLELERTGINRSGTPTGVTVTRVPVSRLKDVAPNAPRPKRGKTAMLVQLDGVRDAPDLRAYRPTSTGITKELSVLRDGRSRTVLLAVPGDACYQVRVPVFGPSASGKERKAEVFIDLKQ